MAAVPFTRNGLRTFRKCDASDPEPAFRRNLCADTVDRDRCGHSGGTCHLCRVQVVLQLQPLSYGSETLVRFKKMFVDMLEVFGERGGGLRWKLMAETRKHRGAKAQKQRWSRIELIRQQRRPRRHVGGE